MKRMRLALFIAIFVFMLSGCDVSNPDGNATVSGIIDPGPPESTSQETEMPQKPDTPQDTKGPETGTTDPEPAETSEASQPTENQQDTENCVHAQWAEDVLTDLSDYERFILGMDEALPLVYFSTESTVEDFKELSLTFESIDDNGNVKFAVEETYYHGTLTPESPLLVRMELMGTIPNNGISYVDQHGALRRFAIEVSGNDGSLSLREADPNEREFVLHAGW